MKQLIVFLILYAGTSFGQVTDNPALANMDTSKTYQLDKRSWITLNGDSTLHAYSISAHEGLQTQCYIERQKSSSQDQAQRLLKFLLSIEVEKMRSDTPGLDSNLFKMLEVKQHPTIQFTLDKPILMQLGAQELSGQGTLTIRDQTKNYPMKTESNFKGKELVLKGSFEINMRHFKLDPPTLLWGKIKTDEMIVISYELHTPCEVI